MSGDETWAALFERAPEGVNVADVRAVLAERRESHGAETGGGEEGGPRDRADEREGKEGDETDG